MKRRIIPRLLVSLLGVLFAASPALSERLPLKIYTSADGLGSSFVDFLMRDSRGFMWFCTRDGLSRFDGARFVTYRVGDKNGPPGIEWLYQTRDGNYWISTTAGMFRVKADVVSQTRDEIVGRPFLNAEFVGRGRAPLLEDRQGNLLYGSIDLYRVTEKDGKFEFTPFKLEIPVTPNRPFGIYQLREAADGSIWMNSNQGVVRRLPDGRLTLYQHTTSVRTGLASMIIGPDGLVWVIWRNDFFVINPAPIDSVTTSERLTIKPLVPGSKVSMQPGAEVHLPSQPDEAIQLQEFQTNPISGRLYQTGDAHVWLSADENLYEFDGRTFHTYGAAQGLPAGMGEIAEDSAGNLWIGGRVAVARLDRRGLTSYREPDGLASKNIQSITSAADGSMYVVNGDFAISRYDGARFETIRPAVDADARALWTSHAGFLSSTGEWWITTTTKLYRFAAGNLSHPAAIYDTRNGFAANDMYQMFEDSHGDLWVSVQPSEARNLGLYRLKKGENSFYRFTKEEGLPDGKSASCFAEDKQGNLWFGFYEAGVVRFANGRFEQFTAKDGLPAGVILDLMVDAQGRLWIASTNGGVGRVDDPGAAKPAFISLTTNEGLTSNNARTIVEDKAGNIYVGTVRGVDRISPDARRIRHYSIADGLAGDFVVDSHCDKNGALWFATTNGLSRLTPGAEEKHPAISIWLGGIRIAGQKQPISELGTAEMSAGELVHTQNNFQIDFFGIDFHAGETLRYQFMLEGADKDWSAPTDQRTVTYGNLRPGSYRFLVRAVDSEGIHSPRPAVLSFTILPPIWLRWWFLTLLTLLVLALLYTLYRYRLANLHQVNLALSEAKTAEEKLGRAREERLTELQKVRTRIATDLHDDIGSSLTQIAILSEVAQQSIKGNGASLAPLKSIANVSNELVESMSDIVWAINPQKDHLQDLIQRMRRFASDLLLAKGIRLDFEAPTYAADVPLGANPRREVFLIFKESLANIVKHSKATQVRIDFDVTSEYLSLKISDNGQGFDASELSAALFSDQKGGHGILSMKKRAAEMNGRFEIKSEPGRGTEIAFQLPLTEAAA
jgi:signal transduction histidine kinase/ligand-binding sensor domain-containing protein